MSVIRSFGVQTIAATNVSQPVFGVALQAASILTPDQFSGNTNPGSNPSLSQVFLEAAGGFRVGDRVAIAPKANFAYPWSLVDVGTIKSFTPGTPYTLAVVQGLLRTHAIGEFFVLNMPAAVFYVERETSVGNLYFGNGSDVSPTSTSLFGTLSSNATLPFQRSSGSQFSPYSTAEFWIYGMANDQFIATWDEF